MHRYRIAAIRLYVALRGRPGTHVAQHLVRSPVELHLEWIDRNLRHRHRNIAVVPLHNFSLRWPVGFDLGKNFVQNLVALRTDTASFIGPQGQDTAWLHNAACFVEEALDIEPVECLRDRNQVDRIGIDTRRFGSCYAKFYLWVWLRRGDLLLTGIRCQDVLEERGKGARGLAIAGSAVPREIMILAKCRQEGEQRIRIAGPVRGVAAGVAGKMILEADVEF